MFTSAPTYFFFFPLSFSPHKNSSVSFRHWHRGAVASGVRFRLGAKAPCMGLRGTQSPGPRWDSHLQTPRGRLCGTWNWLRGGLSPRGQRPRAKAAEAKANFEKPYQLGRENFIFLVQEMETRASSTVGTSHTLSPEKF